MKKARTSAKSEKAEVVERKDFLEEYIEERTKLNPEFRSLVVQAEKARQKRKNAKKET